MTLAFGDNKNALVTNLYVGMLPADSHGAKPQVSLLWHF
jgi:hypothetical protein